MNTQSNSQLKFVLKERGYICANFGIGGRAYYGQDIVTIDVAVERLELLIVELPFRKVREIDIFNTITQLYPHQLPRFVSPQMIAHICTALACNRLLTLDLSRFHASWYAAYKNELIRNHDKPLRVRGTAAALFQAIVCNSINLPGEKLSSDAAVAIMLRGYNSDYVKSITAKRFVDALDFIVRKRCLAISLRVRSHDHDRHHQHHGKPNQHSRYSNHISSTASSASYLSTSSSYDSNYHSIPIY